MKTLARTSSLLLLLALGARLGAQAPAPVLQEIFPPGGQPGATVRVTLTGKRLGQVQSLWFDHPGFRATPRVEEAAAKEPAAKDKNESRKDRGRDRGRASATVTWDIAIDPATPPGLYDLRVVNELGASAPRAFHVSPLPLRADLDPVEGKTVAAEVNARIAGWIEPGLADRFRFKAARKERVVVECLAERIDSRLDATLEARDSSGRRMAYSGDEISLDPVLAFDAEEGGEYTLDLWDFTYGGRYPYLLSISSVPRVRFAFPPAISGASGEVTLYGWNLPGGRQVGSAGEPLEALGVTLSGASGPAGAIPRAYRSTTGLLDDAVEIEPPGVPGEPLVVARADLPPIPEREPNDDPSLATALSIPCSVCARFDDPGDRDWYSFKAAKGQAIEFEILSSRLGFPCDPVLLVARRDAGKDGAAGTVRDLLFLDERKNGYPRDESFQRKFVPAERDPEAVWTAPDDGEYLLQVRNRNGRHGPAAVYLLTARAPSPDFSLVVIHSENQGGEAASVPSGGSQSYDVLIEKRGGFNGVVEVTAEGLPEGVACPPVYLGPGESFVPLIFTSTGSAGNWTGSVRVVGTAPVAAAVPATLAAPWSGSSAALRRVARSAVMIYGGAENKHPQEYVHSRLSSSTLLAVRGPAPFLVRLEPGEKSAAPGGKVSFRAVVERKEGYGEGVQLSFQGLSERAIPDGDGARPAKVTVARDQSSQDVSLTIKNDSGYGRRTLVVYATAPVEYAENPTDPKSKKEKRRTTFASNPVTVEVSPPFSIAALDAPGAPLPGAEVKIPFQLWRLPGVDEEVEVALELPADAKGISAAAVKVPKGRSTGEVRLVASSASEKRTIEGAALRARMQFAGKRFEERSAVSFGTAREKTFELTRVEEARLHVVRFEIGARAGLRPSKDLRLELNVVAPSGGECASTVVLPAGRGAAAVLVDCAEIVSSANDRNSDGNKNGNGLFPLRVQVHASLPGGEVFEEHLLGLPARGGVLAPMRGSSRSF